MDLRLWMIIFGLLIFAAVWLLGVAISGRTDLRQRLFGREVDTTPKPKDSLQKYIKGSEKILKPLGGMIPLSPDEMSRTDRRLVQAGFRRKDGALLFYGVKVLIAVLLLAGFFFSGYLRTNPFLYIVLSVLLGALIPDLWLAARIANRKDRIQLALPDALDLTVICVEAGLGLDQSILRIGQEIQTAYPELSEELNLYSLDVNAGKTRVEALRNLGNRTAVKDLKSLAAVLIQTDRFGTSVATSLRVFSESMRTTRRLRAEEHAAKMSIKMIPALVFFVLPAMFVVVLGPSVISIIRHLLPSLSGR